jgi:hypothetical protein
MLEKAQQQVAGAGILPGKHNRYLKTQPGGVIPARRIHTKTMDKETRETKDNRYSRHEIIITAQNSQGDYVKDASHGRPELAENGELYHYSVAIQSWRNDKPHLTGCDFDVQDDHTVFTYDEAVKVAEELETKWCGPRLLDLDDAQGSFAMSIPSPADFVGFTTYTITTIMQGTRADNGYPMILKRLAECGWGSEPELFQFVGITAAVAHGALTVREDYDDTIDRGIYLDIVYNYAERFCEWLEEWTGNQLDPWQAREIEIRNLMHGAVDLMRKCDDTERQILNCSKEATA